MEALQKMRYVKPAMKFVTDVDIILECVHEVYGMEGVQVLSGKNIHNTMIYPFMKMLENHCSNVSAEGLHKVLWEIYVDHLEKADFLEKAETIIKPYLKNEKEDKQDG